MKFQVDIINLSFPGFSPLRFGKRVTHSRLIVEISEFTSRKNKFQVRAINPTFSSFPPFHKTHNSHNEIPSFHLLLATCCPGLSSFCTCTASVVILGIYVSVQVIWYKKNVNISTFLSVLKEYRNRKLTEQMLLEKVASKFAIVTYNLFVTSYFPPSYIIHFAQIA